MVSNRITSSAQFLQMPLETQALYFHLCLGADDDGVVEAYTILKTLGVADDSLQILIAKNFIYPLNQESVLYVINWYEHNSIRTDRLIKSIYRPLLLEKLPHIQLLEPKPRVDVIDNSKRLNGQSTDSRREVKGSKYSAFAPSNTKPRIHASGDISLLMEKTRKELKERGVI